MGLRCNFIGTGCIAICRNDHESNLQTIMKIRINRLFSSLAAAVTLALSTVCADAGMFIKFDGVDGESVDRDHKGWSDLDSFSFGVEREAAEGGAGGLQLKIDDPSFVKELDKASPKLAQAVFVGNTISSATIHVTRTVDGAEFTYLIITLDNVRVMSNRATVETGAGDLGSENLTLSFENVTWDYQVSDGKGGVAEKVSYSYNTATGK